MKLHLEEEKTDKEQLQERKENIFLTGIKETVYDKPTSKQTNKNNKPEINKGEKEKKKRPAHKKAQIKQKTGQYK